MKILMENVKKGTCTNKEGILSQMKCLTTGGMIIVPDVKGWRNIILREFNAGVSGGHSGYLRTYKRVAFSFMWPEMKGAVKKFVAECDVCQRNHYESISSPGLLQPLSLNP